MKALICTGPSKPEDLTVADLPDPVAGPGEAVVRVEAAALNFFDLLIIAGKYQYKPAFPFSPGAEFAGTVESLGEGVTGFAAGDRVIGYSGWGAARQKLAIAATRLAKMPAGLDADRGCGLIVTYGTSYYALKQRGELKSGETLAVLGASGGTGLAAVELGKIMGARVIACASTDEKLAFAREHGADHGVNYGAAIFATGSRRWAASMASTWSTTRSATNTRSRRCARSPGSAAISWSASPRAKFRSCRSTWCC